MPKINKELLEHLAKLSRINLGENKEKMLDDFSGVVDYFEKLDELDIEGVEPVSGGTRLKNQWREDGDTKRIVSQKAREQFPEEEDGYNKIPPVF